MFIKLCAALFVFLSSLMFSVQGQTVVEAKKEMSGMTKFMSLVKAKRCNTQKPISSISSIKTMLEQPTADMSPALISKVLTTLTCAKAKNTQHNRPIRSVYGCLISIKTRCFFIPMSHMVLNQARYSPINFRIETIARQVVLASIRQIKRITGDTGFL